MGQCSGTRGSTRAIAYLYLTGVDRVVARLEEKHDQSMRLLLEHQNIQLANQAVMLERMFKAGRENNK